MLFNANQQKQTELYCPAYTDDLFNRSEIQKLNEFVHSIPIERAGVGVDNFAAEDHTIRRSNVKWIDPQRLPDWLRIKIIEAFQQINERHFQFILTGAEPFQYTIYSGNERGAYKWHSDMSPIGNEIRKLSMSLLLSESHEFSGGKLIVAPHGDPIVAEEKLGRAVFFPSWMPHCVTPVTGGTRKSLVIWAHGPAFK